MKNNKKVGKMIIISICLLIVVICIVVTFLLNKDTERLEKESEKLETLVVKTKSGTKIETEYTHIENDKFYIKVPKEFKQLSSDDILKKYSGNVPKIVFSNEDMTINLAISMTENKMKDKEIDQYREYMESILKASSDMIESKSYKVDGHTIGRIKLVTKATDTNIYNNMIFFSYQDKLVIITFNCTEKLREDWQPVGDFIIDSLFFKE